MIYLATQKGVNKAESEDAVLIGNEVICDAVGNTNSSDRIYLCCRWSWWTQWRSDCLPLCAKRFAESVRA